MKCVNCGRIIDDNSRFCEYCGEPLQIVEEKIEPDFGRRGYDSYIKCPHCGAAVGSFKAYCDCCGNELRKENAERVIGRLSNALAEVDFQKQQHESSYINIFMRSIYGKNVDTFDDVERKVNIITNCPIPNDRENLLEFMIMASSSIKVEAYNTKQNLRDDSVNRMNKAWLSKMEQVYQKAGIIFEPDSPDYQRISNIYNNTMRLITVRENEGKGTVRSNDQKDMMFWGIILILVVLIIVLGFGKL